MIYSICIFEMGHALKRLFLVTCLCISQTKHTQNKTVENCQIYQSNRRVRLIYQIRPITTITGGLNSWEDCWRSLAHSSGPLLFQNEVKCRKTVPQVQCHLCKIVPTFNISCIEHHITLPPYTDVNNKDVNSHNVLFLYLYLLYFYIPINLQNCLYFLYRHV